MFISLVAIAGNTLNPNLPDLVEKVSPGVVNISSTRYVKQYVMRGMPEFFGMFGIPEAHLEKQSALGSGFIIDSNGYILTNNHVIEKANEVIVNLLDKRRIPAKIIGKDRIMDLALLQLKGGASIPNLEPVKLGDSDKTRIGEPVFAIGNPFGLQHTVTSGIISGKNRTIGIGVLDNFLQTDASINFGNSGGPLLNMKGEVIAINTAINAKGQLLGFAIPIDEAKRHLSDLKNFGYIVRPWFGVLGENVTPAAQYYYNLPVDHGVVVLKMDSKGPGHRAGLRVGDIILQVDNQNVHDRSDIQRYLAKAKVGDVIKVVFQRDSQKLTKELKLLSAPDSNELPDEAI